MTLPVTFLRLLRAQNEMVGQKRKKSAIAAEVDDELKEKRRVQWKLNQRNSRQKRTNLASTLTKENSDAAEAIEALERRLEALAGSAVVAREPMSVFRGNAAVRIIDEYYQVFQNGFATCPVQQQFQYDFVRKIMTTSTSFMNAQGAESVVNQWRLMTTSHHSLRIRPLSCEYMKEEDGVVVRAVSRQLNLQALMSKLLATFMGRLQRPNLLQAQGYIGGRWNPSTGVNVGSIAAMDVVDTEAAVAAAGDALAAWKSRTPFERSGVLQKWDRLLRDNTNDLAFIMSTESGKPLAEAAGEVAYAADYLRFFAHECLRHEGFLVPSHLPGRRLMAMRQPVGVCAMITPWNFPIGMLARKVAPALAAGCTAVVKPAGTTPLSALAFAKLGHDAGVPDGVLNIVPAAHEAAPRIGRALATHPTVRKLSFTGSTSVGKLLAAQCATTMKRVSMELGGNAPFIVFDDANMDEAIDGLIQAKFRNTGQTCVCPNRVFVQATILQKFTDRLVDRVLDLTLGDAVSSGCHLGPLITSAAVDKVLVGGRPHLALGPNYMQATVLAKVTLDMHIANEEVFGPVVPLLAFETESDVIDMANATDMGLAAYCFTSDLGRAWRMSKALEAGMVGINAGVISAVQAPFGGIKQSGQGREGSIVGLDDYTELKYVAMAGLS
ncbi:hypothetical protein DYB38_006053 [Aphanomyces astaci]|uniref:Succinate-semialdehyde dehydrogenase, mitochondrial n=1 Tax=Aphanomyces astaci TaxID=112090 RepID=A0A397FI25_APHAT|nr:hypothetical protein DYB38_006053 [Aphanomyces astaci]RHZ31479.1 hypothetical protein DYB31_002014 [Aphanomyces astaci]